MACLIPESKVFFVCAPSEGSKFASLLFGKRVNGLILVMKGKVPTVAVRARPDDLKHNEELIAPRDLLAAARLRSSGIARGDFFTL